MQAKSLSVSPAVALQLQALGQRIRLQRERQHVTATDTAEAAGLSRVTLHRIERGEPSVTIGAYLGALDAVGLRFDVQDPMAPTDTAIPAVIKLSDYPALQQLAWQLPGVTELRPAQALELYERNWRHLDRERLTSAEYQLIRALVEELGGGRLLV